MIDYKAISNYPEILLLQCKDDISITSPVVMFSVEDMFMVVLMVFSDAFVALLEPWGHSLA